MCFARTNYFSVSSHQFRTQIPTVAGAKLTAGDACGRGHGVLKGDTNSKIRPMGVLTGASVSKQIMDRISNSRFFLLRLRYRINIGLFIAVGPSVSVTGLGARPLLSFLIPSMGFT